MPTNDRTDTIWQGVLAGLVGYATVALLVGILDVALGRSFFFTAALLGEHTFYGLRDPSQAVVWPGAVFAYNGLHLVAFIFIGLVSSSLAFLAEKGPAFWYGGAVLFLVVILHALGALLLMTEDLRAVLPAWMIVLPTVVSGAAMATYLLRCHPRVRHAMRVWEEQEA